MELIAFCKTDQLSIGELLPNKVLPGFMEGKIYIIAKPLVKGRLFIDDEELSDSKDSSQHWIWQPGFYAGEVAAELVLDGQAEPFYYFLDVSPTSSKLGRDKYYNMIKEVMEFSPDLILGTEPSRVQLDGKSANDSAWIAYARMRTWLPRFIRALGKIVERPIRRMKHIRQKLPLHQVNHVDSIAVRQLSGNTALLAALYLTGEDRMQVTIDDPTIQVPFNEMTLDNPANRVMASQLTDVLRRVEQIVMTFELLNIEVQETKTAILPRMKRRLEWLNLMRNRLKAFKNQSPFRDVSSLQLSAAGLNAVATEPVYSNAHQLGARLLKRGLADLGHQMHYLSPTWQVYEAWCFTKLASVLQEVPGYEWQIKSNGQRPTMRLTGKSENGNIHLYYQLVFHSLDEGSGQFFSIGKQRIPDIVLEIERLTESKFYCLDAKYRVSKDALLDAMTSAHIYKDALRKKNVSPDGAFLLVPKSSELPRLAEIDFHELYGEGVFKLEDESDTRLLLERLIGFMQA